MAPVVRSGKRPSVNVHTARRHARWAARRLAESQTTQTTPAAPPAGSAPSNVPGSRVRSAASGTRGAERGETAYSKGHLHVVPLESSVVLVRCLSRCLFFSLLFLLLFFLRESSLEVLDNTFFLLLFGSVTLSLLMKITSSRPGCYTDPHEARAGLSLFRPSHGQRRSRRLMPFTLTDSYVSVPVKS